MSRSKEQLGEWYMSQQHKKQAQSDTIPPHTVCTVDRKTKRITSVTVWRQVTHKHRLDNLVKREQANASRTEKVLGVPHTHAYINNILKIK